MIMSINTREKNRYRGFTLHKGYVYGRDDKSPFVSAMRRDATQADGLNATIMLWRLDMESTRGWYEVWEQSATTSAIIDFYCKRNPNKNVTKAYERYAKPSSLAQVRNFSHTIVFC